MGGFWCGDVSSLRKNAADRAFVWTRNKCGKNAKRNHPRERTENYSVITVKWRWGTWKIRKAASAGREPSWRLGSGADERLERKINHSSLFEIRKIGGFPNTEGFQRKKKRKKETMRDLNLSPRTQRDLSWSKSSSSSWKIEIYPTTKEISIGSSSWFESEMHYLDIFFINHFSKSESKRAVKSRHNFLSGCIADSWSYSGVLSREIVLNRIIPWIDSKKKKKKKKKKKIVPQASFSQRIFRDDGRFVSFLDWPISSLKTVRL
jgi:hypothetical protein